MAIMGVLFLKRRKSHQISTITMLGLTVIALGIIFGDNRCVGYPLIGAGVLLAIIDAVYVKRTEKR
jgi:hypothetical protein